MHTNEIQCSIDNTLTNLGCFFNLDETLLILFTGGHFLFLYIVHD